jgi:carbon-monoxide dehydrogenase medium subunit
MKPAPFEYFAPTSAEAALDLLGEHGADAKLLAGGQSLVPTMNFRLAQPSVLVDLNRISDLAFVRPNGVLSIGAMTRQAALERSPEVARHAPLLAAALPHIAHPQIRNRGTLGGSLAHADPAAELPAVAVALGAEIVVRNRRGERRHAARDFFQGLFSTTLEPDDLLVAVDFPALPEGTGWSFQEVARRHGDYALVGVAATLGMSGSTCRTASIVLFAVGGGPVVAAAAQALLEGAELTDARIHDAARCAAHDDIDPVGDIHASAAYKRHLAEVLVGRALHEARARARATERSEG